MTEAEYQASIRAIDQEMKLRARDLADYLVSQPPFRVATDEAVRVLWWAVQAGAAQATVVQERQRRIRLNDEPKKETD